MRRNIQNISYTILRVGIIWVINRHPTRAQTQIMSRQQKVFCCAGCINRKVTWRHFLISKNHNANWSILDKVAPSMGFCQLLFDSFVLNYYEFPRLKVIGGWSVTCGVNY